MRKGFGYNLTFQPTKLVKKEFNLTLKVMMVLLIAGCAAATAIGYVGQFGEDHVGWQPICDHVRKFCTTNLVSLLLSYFAFISYFGITLLSAYKIVSSSPKN